MTLCCRGKFKPHILKYRLNSLKKKIWLLNESVIEHWWWLTTPAIIHLRWRLHLHSHLASGDLNRSQDVVGWSLTVVSPFPPWLMWRLAWPSGSGTLRTTSKGGNPPLGIRYLTSFFLFFFFKKWRSLLGNRDLVCCLIFSNVQDDLHRHLKAYLNTQCCIDGYPWPWVKTNTPSPPSDHWITWWMDQPLFTHTQ